MHQALYRKWRPRSFDEVCGQEHITSILKYEVAHNTFSHAYLFCGSRGTGKTSCAKILSKAVNCLSPRDGSPCGECAACRAIDSGSCTDVIEMDAASNNGVDNIRDIRDEVVYSPSNLKYRVYIIDEVHMLSTSAFNALLKTLEEPPEHVVFILATTELHKLPSTIISRCQRFDFRRISTAVLQEHLLHVAKTEGIEIEESAALLLAKQAQGGMRDAISLLELCAGSRAVIDDALVNDTVGKIGRENMLSVVKAVQTRDYETIFESVDEVFRSSRDITVFWQDLSSVYRDLLVIKTSANASAYLDLTDSETKALTEIAAGFTLERLSYHCSMLRETLLDMQKVNSIRRITAEMTLVKMCDERLDSSPEAMLSRISELEARLNSGNFTPPTPSTVREASPEREIVGEQVKESAKETAEARPARAARRPVVTDDDDEMFRGDAPGAVSAPKTASAPQGAPATVSRAEAAAARRESRPATSVAPSANVRVLKPFKSRAEVMERLTVADEMAAGFFHLGKWYTDENGNIIVKFDSASTIDMITVFNGDNSFLRTVSAVMGRQYSKNQLILECDATKKSDSVIDKIIEAAES